MKSRFWVNAFFCSFLSLSIVAVIVPLVGCAKKAAPCPPNMIERTFIKFICPQCGAEYQVEAVKCINEARYRLDTTCPVCGYNYRNVIVRWPYPYIWDNYYFYNGWWYQRDYWLRYWPYPSHPIIRVVPTPLPPSVGRTNPMPQPRPQPPGIHRPEPIQPPPPGHGNIQRPPIPGRPPVIERPPAPPSRPPTPPPVMVRPTPMPPPTPPVKK